MEQKEGLTVFRGFIVSLCRHTVQSILEMFTYRQSAVDSLLFLIEFS